MWQVNITSRTECKIPFGIGVASDPMALRRGGKKLAMEDVCYYRWPLPGTDQVLECDTILVVYKQMDYRFLNFHIAVRDVWYLRWTWRRRCSHICQQVSLFMTTDIGSLFFILYKLIENSILLSCYFNSIYKSIYIYAY